MTDTNTYAQGLRDHAGAGPIRLLPADHRASVRKGLAVEKNLELVGEADGAAGAVPLIRVLRSGMNLPDREMPGVSGIEATEDEDVARREGAPRERVAAFVAESRTEETVLAAIRRVAAPRGTQRRHARASIRREERTDDMRDRRDP